ncbi:hypothetical protein DPMN_121951 [Dreissena polymorpha]|uniref:Uncharacterized protein n=1 Tax=Dreissena polymorpha TaxID=45954 RepID=A0A9D4JU14_DREPO|nr:hypothetical protein DPMN_121951 [Dreissena polymorpha]
MKGDLAVPLFRDFKNYNKAVVGCKLQTVLPGLQSAYYDKSAMVEDYRGLTGRGVTPSSKPEIFKDRSSVRTRDAHMTLGDGLRKSASRYNSFKTIDRIIHKDCQSYRKTSMYRHNGHSLQRF